MMRVSDRITLGTRGSELARAQTALVELALRAADPELEIEVQIIKTRGDEKSGASSNSPEIQAENSAQGRKGLFTSEIERALAERQIDVAVHSAKDLPSEGRAGLEIIATLPRAAVEDVLVTRAAATFDSLPHGATIATGSVRRQNQIRWLRADLSAADLRGNVPTRLRKLKTEAWDAIILARAGLERLGFDCSRGAFSFEGQSLHVALLSRTEFVPAGGQGIIALQVRTDDPTMPALMEKLNHAETLLSLRAEREFLRLLQGDCATPVGVLAQFEGELMMMRGQIFDHDSARPRVAQLRQARAGEAPESLAAELLELINDL